MADFARKFFKTAGLVPRAARFALREPGTALTVLRMAAWVAAVSLLLKRMPLPRVLNLVEPRRRRTRAGRDAAQTQARLAEETQAKLARLLDALLATDVLCFTPTCWKRAPVLHRFLALEGIETRVLFGVRREGAGELGGHAWLEAGGQPLLETTAPDYKVTYSFPA
ncbi:MAG: lasso peptide biosynthesis B2 protein [Acidobacteriota bacterium]|nr:lasso peptide biosynthesis B2 protein [Acidobacteriota bacterium]